MFFSKETVVQCHVVKDKGELENTGTVPNACFLGIVPRSYHFSNNPSSFGTQITRFIPYLHEFGAWDTFRGSGFKPVYVCL
jgi:hypothetical protein